MNDQQRERFTQALDRLGNDEETLVTLAEMAVEDAPRLIDKMDDHVADQHWSEYAKTAHSLKGLLTTFETGGPVSEIQELIDEARAENGDAVSNCHRKTKPKLLGLVQEIDGLTKAR